MKGVACLTRLLVLGAGFFLLVPNLRRSPAQVVPQREPGDCIFAIDQPNTPCPSGCTTSSFTQWVVKPATNGVDYLKDNGPAPCGSAKPGEQCSPPTWWSPQNDYKDCCAALGEECLGNYDPTQSQYKACCQPSPVVCMAKCCIDNGGSCSPSRPGDCCTELCLSYNNECGTCSTLGQPCGNPDDCCYFYGVTCPYGFCCIGKGQPCAQDSDCCNHYCLPCGMCAVM
jgi:hypothetical protein